MSIKNNNENLKIVTVTHRGTNENIIKKVNAGKLIPHLTIVGNEKRRKLEDIRPVIWICEGKPSIWNKLNSGMVSKQGEAYISFKLEKNRIDKPTGIKRIFGKSQRVITEEILLEEKSIVEIKVYRKKFYSMNEAKKYYENMKEI